MRYAWLAMGVLVLDGCGAGHDSCGVQPPVGYERWPTDEPREDAMPPPPWSASRIEQALAIDPAPAMKTLSRGDPVIVVDADAGTLTPMCRKAAFAAIEQFGDDLGPRNAPPTCSEIAVLQKMRTLVCVRPHDGHNVVGLAFFRRGDEWDLTVLMKGARRDATLDAQMLARLPDRACP
jgi:hypothetical protein